MSCTRGARQASRTLIAYSGLTTATTNDKGQTRVEERNVDGKVVRTTDSLGAQTAFQHDAYGNLVVTKDALQNQIGVGYDARGRKVSMSDPDTGLWKYDYDALGQLVWQQSPNQRSASQATTMAYDVLGRMTSRTEPEYVSTWSYDKNADGTYCMSGTVATRGAGRLCESNTSNGINRKVTYDSLGRPTNSRTTVTNGPSFASAVGYDGANGRLSNQTYTNRNGVVNGSLSVAFGYESRPDRIQTFHAGSSSRQTQRLSRIETYRDFVSATSTSIQPGLLVRGYDIVYDAIEDASNQGIRATNTSRIKRIQERDATGATLPAIEFTLAPDVVMGQVVAHRPSATTATPPPPAYCTGILAYKTDRECP